MDEGSGQGTYVNQERLEPGQPLVLNVDDLIGFGSSEAQSSRIDGQESFVYRLRAPAAFQSLEAGDDDLGYPVVEDVGRLDLGRDAVIAIALALKIA